MLDIKFIRENPEKVKEGVRKKNAKVDVDALLRLDADHRKLLSELEELRAEQNKKSKEAKGESAELKELKVRVQSLDKEESEKKEELDEILHTVPNLPFENVPVGPDESGNVVVREVGEKPKFDFPPKDYLVISEKLDIIDVERASQVSGSRFGYLKGRAALLEFALIQYTMKALTDKEILKGIIRENPHLEGISSEPFVPVVPPVMLKPNVFRKMARLNPGEEEERYYIQKDDLYLAGSAEHTLGPLHMDETLAEENLPKRYIGFSTSFRREAGSYGKDTKGILRVHQFDKLEMESFCLPELSRKEHEFIVACQEYLMKGLNIPYRVVEICTGDMGGPDARQIDLEAWMPGQGTYRETHTADLMTDYQARRLQTKVKRRAGSKELVHMVDATAFAIGRTLIAIIENYQTKDGEFAVPEALKSYLPYI
ncbi:MAG: serine--tRNA ligase [bacterium]|nr:serine--tRNA ligase [bacterium]